MVYLLLLSIIFSTQSMPAAQARRKDEQFSTEQNYIQRSNIITPVVHTKQPHKKNLTKKISSHVTQQTKQSGKKIDRSDDHDQINYKTSEQKKADHAWPQKNSLIQQLENAIKDIPQKSKDNRKIYKQKVDKAFQAYKALYDYNRSTKMFVTEAENHKIMESIEKLFKHKHIENMVWHTNILKN